MLPAWGKLKRAVGNRVGGNGTRQKEKEVGEGRGGLVKEREHGGGECREYYPDMPRKTRLKKKESAVGAKGPKTGG